MYPVTLGLFEAKQRIKKLISNGHYSEGLVTSMFTLEKTIMRTLKQLVISAGFSSKYASLLMDNIKGLEKIKKNWKIFDPRNRSLIEVIGSDNWEVISRVSKMRNNLVHGVRTYELSLCEKIAYELLRIIDNIDKIFKDTYGYNGWSKLSQRRKSTLHSNPTIKL